MKFLGLIRAVTLLYQHQRPVKTAAYGGGAIEYIESTREDIWVAEELIAQIMGDRWTNCLRRRGVCCC